MRHFVGVGIGGFMGAFLSPWLWKHVIATTLGYELQSAVLAGLGAMLGGYIVDRLSWKKKD